MINNLIFQTVKYHIVVLMLEGIDGKEGCGGFQISNKCFIRSPAVD
jgi:hypothetical protein